MTEVANWSAPDGGHDTTAGGVETIGYTLSDFSSYTYNQYDQIDMSTGTPTSGLVYSSTTDPDGNTTKTYTDGDGRTIRTVYPDGSFSETLYSTNGIVPTTDAEGDSITLPSTGDGWIGTGTGNLTLPNGDSATIQIQERGTGQTPVYTISVSDAAGDLIDEWQPGVLDSDPNSPTHGQTVQPHWSYTYDEGGNETSQTDPKGNTTYWTYDQNGNMLTHTLPGGQQESWTYDQYGNMISHTDFDGNVSDYTYSTSGTTAGLETEAEYYLAGDGSPEETVSYQYDDMNRVQTVTDSADGGSSEPIVCTYDPVTGNVSQEVTPQGTINYVYDDATGLLTETWTGTSQSDVITDTLYGYTNQGQLASVTIAKQDGAAPNDLSSSNTEMYNADGDEVSTSLPTTLYTYDADGNVTRISYPNGTETDYDYSEYWTPQGGNVFGTEVITNRRGSVTLSSFTYDFDSDQRKISDLEFMLDPGEGSSNTSLTTWTYDALSRLTQEKYDYGDNDGQTGGNTTDDFTDNYSYDLDGNRVLETVDQSSDGSTDQSITDTYDHDNRLLTETATSPTNNADFPAYSSTYSYDDNGSTTQVVTTGSGAGTDTYSYDARNRMIASTVGGAAATDAYDDDGNLISQTAGGTTTTFLLDKNNPTGYSQVVEAWTGGTTPAVTYTIGNTVLGQNAGGVMSFIMPDDEGSTRQLTAYTSSTSTNGKVTARYDYDAFGNSIQFTNSSHPTNTADTDILFQNEPLDPTTGNYRMEVREESPGSGRFTTQDNIRLQPGILDNANLYIFVGGDPIDFADPTGCDAASDMPAGYDGSDAMGDDAFGLAAAVGAENLAGYMAASQYASSNFGLIGAYTAASFAFGDLVQNTLALDQQAAFAIAGSVGGSLIGLTATFLSDLTYGAINALLYADTSAGAAAAGLADVGVDVASAASAGTVTVTHFTDAAGVSAITNAGYLRVGTYVTLPSEVSGLTASEIETALEIAPGKGAFSTTFEVAESQLKVPINGALTSGGKIQFQLTEPITPGVFTPTPR